MRSYSKQNLLQRDLEMMPNGKVGFLNRIAYKMYKSLKVKYEIEIPKSIYLRGIAFCEDFSERYGYDLTPSELIFALYSAFIARIRRENDLDVIYTQYMLRMQEQEIYKSRKNDKYIELDVFMEHDLALRGEMALADMDTHVPNHPLTIEKILEIEFIFCVTECQKGSKNHKNLMKEMISYLEE
ncbi:MAG TPA: hypothetical protein VNM69_15315 [Bacillus sp. (in: firmicutes)]|nr:hypothetical protein [Bacillus sp. (in: firmicutes)]